MDKLDLKCMILLFLLSFFVCSFLPVKKNAKFTTIFAFDEPFLLDEREELFFYGLKSIFFSHSFALNQSFFNFSLNQSVDVLWKGEKPYLAERPLYLLANLLPASIGFSLRNEVLAYNLLRLFHIICFSLNICLFYLFGRKFGLSRRASLLSSTLFAFSTGMLVYSRMFLPQIFDLILILSLCVSVLYGMKGVSYIFLFLLSTNFYTIAWLLLVFPLLFLKLERK
ncbi:MAG: hypothetical protein J7L59_01120, partial [Nanoarchaeota archaeon]|nr:hypothetical protein [Nanoarchaeota archaeon]